jgi:hypothetical protein
MSSTLLRSFVDLKLELLAWRIFRLTAKFDPNQPRVPAGVSEGGQWTRVGGGSIESTWDEKRRPQCDVQMESDLFQCRMMPRNPFCENQAMSRWVACMKGHPIPPLFHVM